MKRFDEQWEELKPTFRMLQYMRMIREVHEHRKKVVFSKHQNVNRIESLGRELYEAFRLPDFLMDQSCSWVHPKGSKEILALFEGVSTQYKICDTTDISNINMKQLLSLSLTTYFADKMSRQEISKKNALLHGVLTLDCLKSSQEDADTKILLHAINAKDRSSDRLLVFAQDTDIFALLVRRYPRLPELTFFVPSFL
ncbi:hypothetical protein ILUMI_24830 [Ignelater luminosus]|uniref:Uncharacterized protein n=1 Tax=Ignelater luminosus TaxID=2038154 RepID=A0A8K0CB51_IGNLU|nr:hypothetical protein ILUMI_24830 [Ignelater luminosus]